MLPFIVVGHSGPESSVHDVSVARIPDEGEVADSSLLAPEAGAAVVGARSRRGVDPGPSVEVYEVLSSSSVVCRSVPVDG